jgi:hypothetical protein
VIAEPAIRIPIESPATSGEEKLVSRVEPLPFSFCRSSHVPRDGVTRRK